MNSKTAQLSLELQILVESIKISLLQKPGDEFSALINMSTVDWKRLRELMVHHRIRPLFYEASRIVGLKNETIDQLKNFSMNQALLSMISGEELGRILSIYKENNIGCLPYKGVLFSDKLYKNKALRESGDIDILVKPDQAVEAIKLLHKEGYIFSNLNSEIGEIDDELLEELVNRTQIQELSLIKELSHGIKIHIDFHWAIGETFHKYNIQIDELFEESSVETFQRRQLLIPNAGTIFKMLLNHHGGRGCWLRLKDFADLIAFRNQYPDYYHNNAPIWATETKMRKVFDMGNAITESIFFESPLDTKVEKETQQRILKGWETTEDYDVFKTKFNHRRIYRRLQDEHLSWVSHLSQLLVYYSIPNRMEKKRLFVFPDKFVYLNVLSKAVSYLWSRIGFKS
jgi:hypothetical protein